MTSGYAAPELLVETAWLDGHLGDPGPVIVEVGSTREDFEAGHIPGAVHCPDAHIKAGDNPALVASPREARALFEPMGVGDGTSVIAYDRTRSRNAARLWWVLGYYGHSDVRVLNGGWKKWTLEGRRTDTGPDATPAGRATFTPVTHPEVNSTVETLRAAIDDPGAGIWDVRTIGEYTGEDDRGNTRRGHVPGARHLEWVHLVSETDHTFKPADDIRELVRPLGITPDTSVHVY